MIANGSDGFKVVIYVFAILAPSGHSYNTSRYTSTRLRTVFFKVMVNCYHKF